MSHNNNNARYKESELREKDINANTKIYFKVLALLYFPAFTQKDFHYPLLDLPQRDLHGGITNTYEEYTTSTLSHTSLHRR